MKTLFETSMSVTKGGRNGLVSDASGDFQLTMSMPKALGGTGEGTNPEQLFAAGYAACFSNAALLVAKMNKTPLKDVPVKATVGLVENGEGGYKLNVSLSATVALPQEKAEALIAQTHKICPYSNAIQGNIDVQIEVLGE